MRRPLRHLAFLFFFASSLLSGTHAATPPRVYRSAVSILTLPLDSAREGYPAQLRGVVTQSTDDGLVVQDETAGIWIYWDTPDGFVPGDLVDVKGSVGPGLFAPVVQATAIERIGRVPLPKAKEVTYEELSAGAEDCQYVSVTGTIRSASVREGASPKQKLWLRIAMQNGPVDASLPVQYANQASKLIDALVRVEAASLCSKNENRQIITATLSINNMDHVTVLRPAPPDLFAKPLTPIGRLMQYRSGTDYTHRVKVAGTVTYYKPGESIILEENGKALFVQTTQSSPIGLGDHVEALGFPAAQGSGPILQDAILRRMSTGAALTPNPVRVADLCSGSLNYNLITTQGQLLRAVREPSREVLLVQDDASIVLVELAQPRTTPPLPALQEGSMVQVSGISVLEVAGSWNYGMSSASAIQCKLLLRSPADVQVLGPPSWWSTRHVFYIAALLGAMVLAFLGLAVYIRVKQWRLQAVHQERERLAHEIHDTLAQSFSGIGFQLQAIRKEIPNELPRLRQQVDVARELVRHSHKEARRSIEPLELDAREHVDLLSSLEQSARKMVEGGSVEVKATRQGSPRQLSPQTTEALFRIGQESIANAVRHADPSLLQISLQWDKDVVRLAVRDDGVGFVKSGNLLGFGLRGMRRRAAAIHARLEIYSQPRQGTRVEVVAPIPPNASLATVLKKNWTFVAERFTHVKAEPDSDPDR